MPEEEGFGSLMLVGWSVQLSAVVVVVMEG